ncbi:MAG: hypothetical protein FWD88_06735, partial [Treponema sp.]|nr:hypothetical protein [Treponema sp.]
MKKNLFAMGVLAFMLVFWTEMAHGQFALDDLVPGAATPQIQGAGLDDAIQNVAMGLSPNIGRDARIAVVAMAADSAQM